MNEQRYQKISNWVRKSDQRYRRFVMVYRILPYVMVAAYAGCVIYELAEQNKKGLIRVIVVPAITFLICTVFRKFINAGRPYEKMNISPLIVKDKKGQSFPSRHTVAAAIIGMTALYVNTPFGIFALFAAALTGGIRPVAGVHYIKDVLAGYLFGVAAGIVGFFMI